MRNYRPGMESSFLVLYNLEVGVVLQSRIVLEQKYIKVERPGKVEVYFCNQDSRLKAEYWYLSRNRQCVLVPFLMSSSNLTSLLWTSVSACCRVGTWVKSRVLVTSCCCIGLWVKSRVLVTSRSKTLVYFLSVSLERTTSIEELQVKSRGTYWLKAIYSGRAYQNSADCLKMPDLTKPVIQMQHWITWHSSQSDQTLDSAHFLCPIAAFFFPL